MGIMDAATRRAVQAELLASLFAGTPPDPAEILPRVEAAAVARGYTLAESSLRPWGRKLEMELGALSGGLDRRLGQVPGLSSGTVGLAQRAVSGVMTLRGEGIGPSSWALWLDQDFTWNLAESIATEALAGSPVASIVGIARDALEAAAVLMGEATGPVIEEDEDALSLGPDADLYPGHSGTGSFGPVAFVASAETVRTWRDASREHKGRYATHEVLGATPRLEFLSADISQTSFSVRLDAALGASPTEDAETLTGMAKTGRVELLILGGRNLGRHVLEGVRESWRHTGPGGVVMVADLELTFKEYADGI